jgi:mannosyltransferase
MTTTSGERPATDEAPAAGPTPPAPVRSDRPAGPEGLRGRHWLLGLLSWLVPTGVTGLVVRYQIADAQLWRDEFASWSVSTRTVPQILELGKHIDGVTVPYYLFLHYWIRVFGDSVIVLRMPSAIAMAATAGMVALLARRLYGNLAGLWAGLLIAAVPAVSRYGQEVRGYALATMFAALATLLLVLALQKNRWWIWAPYAVSIALLGLAHQVALLVLAGHFLAVLTFCYREGRRRVLWWALATVAGLLAILPFALNGLGQHGAQLSWLTPATLDGLAAMPGAIFGTAIVGGAIAAIAAFALPRRGETGRNDGWSRLLWLSVLIPFGLLYAVDQLVAPIFLDRYLLFLVPPLCVLAGRALSTLRWHTALAVGLVVTAVGLPAQVDDRATHSGFDYKAIAQLLSANAEPGDGVIYAPRGAWQFTDEAMRYYLGPQRPKDVLMQSSEIQNASLWAIECADGPACIAGTPRVFTVISDDVHKPGQPSAERLSTADKAALASYRSIGRWDLRGFIINLYVRK